MLAVIRVRGTSKVNVNVKRTLKLLRLTKPNHCVVISSTKEALGMIIKAKDYLTWGNISEKTLKNLVEKRGKISQTKRIEKKDVDDTVKKILEGKIKDTKIKPVFMLSPPRHGYESKGVKSTFNEGGALGDRKDEIGELIERMI